MLNRGLIIGKFMPLHKGHIALIRYAQKYCRQVIVLLGVRQSEIIAGSLRLDWLKQTFDRESNIKIEYTENDLPEAPYSSRAVARIWADFLKKRYPSVEVVFSSEKYGQYLAEYMGIKHMPFDAHRKKYPVSATMIRRQPLKYWDFIAKAAHPCFLKRVCIYGAESTGKSVLTQKLARYYKTSYVPEMAREILGDRHVVYEDIPVIAETQTRAILQAEKVAQRILFCDTDLITTRIYSQYYFKKVPPFPAWIEQANHYDIYLFMEIDTPWLKDSQRDCGHNRKQMRDWFLRELKQYKLTYVIIKGSWEERFKRAREIIETRWKNIQ
jgi:HTH-type transcriptional repressor of NAD biosynthesis genes